MKYNQKKSNPSRPGVFWKQYHSFSTEASVGTRQADLPPQTRKKRGGATSVQDICHVLAKVSRQIARQQEPKGAERQTPERSDWDIHE
jgi:hypothetical protein